jgi:cyanophycin synthetase
MDVSRIRALRGPNIWSRHTAVEALVSCTGAECDISDMQGFETRLRAQFPEIGFLQPAGHDEGISLAHVLEVAALSLQKQAGCLVTFSSTVQTDEAGVYKVVIEYGEEAVGRLALEIAQKLCRSAVEDTTFDLAHELTVLRELDEDERLGPSTGSIVQAAHVRGIPFRRLTTGSMVQLGWGSQQRRIQAAETDQTSAIAQSIAQDKELTKKLLSAAGVPIPFGRPVDDEEDAWAAAEEIGLPVVIKPQDGNQGKGVTVNIVSRDHLRIAYAAAATISSSIMVERYLPGHDYRLLVVGGKLIAAARRDPPQVIGDGIHNVRELVDIVNSDPRRSDGHATALTKIRLDEIALVRLSLQGYSVNSIPPKGGRVILRNNANLSTGGSATDVTDDVHPEVAERAVAAAQMIGLDICGVDVMCDSLIKSLEEQGGGVIEVNAAPGLRMHLQPSFGKPRAVGEAIISTMFKQGADARIPLVAVTGTNGKTTTVRLIAHLLAQKGLRVGMTNSDGVYVENQRIDTGDCSGPKSARNILLHPDVDAAVFETARGGVLREGLAFDRCDVAVVTNLGVGDHLGLNHINTVDELALVKRVVVQNVSPAGTAVLNAADPYVAKMSTVCPGTITFFASDHHHPVMATHRAKGFRVVFREGHEIVAAEGAMEERFMLADIPLTRNGSIGFQIENSMASIGAAWALGIDWKIIRLGLASFVNDAATAPGRFNVYDYKGATLIADYGHNPDAILALVSAVENMPGNHRIAVISGAGDRRDEDIRRQTERLSCMKISASAGVRMVKCWPCYVRA